MAKSKFQNLTVDMNSLRRLSMTDRLSMLRSSDGISILPNFTPSQLNELFPFYYRRTFTDIGQAFKAVSDKRNLTGGVNADAAELQSRSELSSRPTRVTATATWQDRLREKTGVNINDPVSGPAMERLKREISRGEGGYDSVNRGNAGDTPGGAARLLGRPLSDFTVGEIMDMQKGGRDQRKLFAVGKYQFIPKTLAEAVRWTGIDKDAKFDSATQEKLFEYTISEKKRPALAAYLSGKSNDRNAALRDLSLEYASIPGPNGKGAYDRDRAGNMAHGGMKRAEAMLNMLTEAREERLTAQTSQPESSVEAPQLPSGLAPKLLEELNRMSPRQQQKFMTALDKIGGVEKMNDLYAQNPNTIDRAAAQGASFSYSNVAFSSDRIRSGISNLSQEAQATLQRLDSFGIPVTVTSTYRSPEQNAKTAGSSRSSLHMSGNAIDIRTNDKSPEELQRTVQALKRAGFNKVLIENNHLHAEYHKGSNEFNLNVRKGHSNPNINLEQAQQAASSVQFRESLPEPENSSQSTATPLQKRVSENQQSTSSPVEETKPVEEIKPALALGGDIKTDAKQLNAYAINKSRQRRDDMVVTDGAEPLFTMNSEEEMKFSPQTGKVSVNPSARGLKANPEELQERLKPPVEPMETRQTQTTTNEIKDQGQQQPVIINQSPATPVTNSYDSITDGSIQKMSPSFERAVARSRFVNTGDAVLGGHFDFGASNMA